MGIEVNKHGWIGIWNPVGHWGNVAGSGGRGIFSFGGGLSTVTYRVPGTVCSPTNSECGFPLSMPLPSVVSLTLATLTGVRRNLKVVSMALISRDKG